MLLVVSIAIAPFGSACVGAPSVTNVTIPCSALKTSSVTNVSLPLLYKVVSPVAVPDDHVILPPASMRTRGYESVPTRAETASSPGLANSVQRSGVPTNLVIDTASTVSFFIVRTPRGAMNLTYHNNSVRAR